MSVPAFIYARFSTAEQSKGHSLKRQFDGARKYVQQKGWLYDPEREIKDEGRSAFHGINRAEGSALYQFEQETKEGRYRNGAVLVAENIDRFTRQGWEEATDLLRFFTSNGVTVAFWDGDDVFEAGGRIELVDVIKLVLKSELGSEESKKKAARLKAAWDARIRAAQSGAANTKGMLPSWLERDPQTKLARAIPHRANVLNHMYDMYIEGQGTPKVVHWLNSTGEPTWGRGKQADKIWSVSQVNKLLSMRAVLGEYQPQERYQSGVKRKAKCAPIADYYPQVISTEKYNRAQAVKKSRTGWGGPKTATFRNLFTGIARCSECGGKMHMTTLLKPGKKERHLNKRGDAYRESVRTVAVSYLYCFDHNRGTTCTNGKRIRYQHLEAGVMAMLPRVFERVFAKQQAHPVSALADRAAELERSIANKKQQMDSLVENLTREVNTPLAKRLTALEQEVEQSERLLEKMKRDVAAELGKPLPREEVEEVARLYGTMNDGSEDEQQTKRSRVNTVLRGLIQAMECKPDGTTMLVAGNALGLTFDAAGECTDVSALNARYEGPDGERNWHPDAEAA